MANIKWTPLEHQRAPFFDNSPYVGLVGGLGCVAKGTMVQTPNGLKEFTTLKPFDEVYSYDNGQIVISRCLGAYKKGLDTLYRVTHEHGEFVATGAHRTFSDRCKYLRVSEISPSSRLFWVSSIPQGHVYLMPSSTKITRIREWSIGSYYDTHVIGTNNYITEDGTIHHNSGKTSFLVNKLLRLATQNIGLDGGLLVPDLKMFKRDVMPMLAVIERDNNVRLKYHHQDGYINLPYTNSKLWVFHDQDKGESIRGPNLAYVGVNEATLISKEGFEAIIGRVRLKEAKVPQIAWSGTPEGFGYLYREHVEKQRTDSKVYYGSTVANTHLHQSFVDRLKSSYDETLLKAYLEGQFVNLTGRPAAYAFNRKFHVEQCRIQPGRYSVWVSLDFNVNPMAATLFYRVTDMGNLRLWAFDCIKLRSSDTNEMARVIKEKVGTNCTIYPDPAGNSRSTKNISITDITILEDAGFKDIKFKRRIASVRECLNALNNMLSKNEIMFDPKCVDAINDLEQTELKDSGDLDKSDQDRTHFIDGIKNMVDYEFPVLKPLGSSTIRL